MSGCQIPVPAAGSGVFRAGAGAAEGRLVSPYCTAVASAQQPRAASAGSLPALIPCKHLHSPQSFSPGVLQIDEQLILFHP